MDDRTFMQVGTAVIRFRNGETTSEPIFIEAYRLYKLCRTDINGHGTTAHTERRSRPCAGGLVLPCHPVTL